MKIADITKQINGHWQTVFNKLGFNIVKNKHCPCPICGGKDRFRFDDKDGRGTWICNQCGAGDGLELVKRYYHCTNREAAETAAAYAGIYIEQPNKKAAVNQIRDNPVIVSQNHNNHIPENTVCKSSSDLKSDLATNMCDNPISKKVEYLLSQSTLGQSEYLTKKGLTFDLPLLDNGRIFVPLLNLHNEYTGGQFIEADGSKHLMKGTNKKGAFIAVNPSRRDEVSAKLRAPNEIIICEGLATGITLLSIKPDSVILAAVDAGNLIHVASAVREVNPTAKIIIAGDNDIGNDKNTGKEKAIDAAKVVKGYYSIPDTDYKCDWDDYRQNHGIDKTRQVFDENLKNEPVMNMQKDKVMPDLSSINLTQMASSQRAELLNQHYDNNLAVNLSTDEIYHYQGNAWKLITEQTLKRTLADIFTKAGENFNPMRISSAVDSLKLILPVMGETQRDLICFKNGVYDIATGAFRKHDKQDWLNVSNNINYYPANEKESLQTHAPNFYKWLDYATAKDLKKAKRVLAALYMILANRYDWQLFIEVTGAGGSGKSVFSEIATMLAGEQNTVIGTMESLEKARDRALIVGHSLIILPDQPRYVGSGAGLKAITGGDEVAIDPKHKQPYSCKIPAVVLVINNEAMRFNERAGGVSRRRVIFHFGEVVAEHQRDITLTDKIRQELPTIVRHLLSEFKKPIEAKSLLHEQQQSDEAKAIKRESDHLVDFCSYLDSLDYPNGMFIGNMGIIPFNPRKYLYHAYIEYIRNTGLTNPLSLTQFGVSISYAMKENGKEYMRKRANKGIRTNVELNTNTSHDWLPKAEGKAKIENH